MANDIFMYQVREEIPPFDPMYGKSREVKYFGEDKAGAIEWAKTHYKERPYPERVYVVERQYTSQRNFERDFPLYVRWIWSANWYESNFFGPVIEHGDI